MESKDIELVYRGVRVGLGSEYDDYKSCVVTALNVYYDEFPEMILEQSDDDYQGSTVGVAKGSNYIPNFGPKYYYYSFGWGSCSGCDLLEAEGPIATIENLRTSIVPIPLETISVTKYLENETVNSYDKDLVKNLLQDWKEYIEKNSLDEFGRRVFKKK